MVKKRELPYGRNESILCCYGSVGDGSRGDDRTGRIPGDKVKTSLPNDEKSLPQDEEFLPSQGDSVYMMNIR